MKKAIVDGCEAVARIAYKFSEVIPVYPITPSSPMAELCTSLSARGEKNIFGEEVKTIEMQSEAGVAGAMHGALLSGALSNTFSSSQGLLLMIPNMYKIAGENLPNVIHVASRAVATHALNIFCDHSDVMATRSTGYIMLSSSNVQEAQDLALASHLFALESGLPVLHFMDGFRTSHELQKINLIEENDIKSMLSCFDIKNIKLKKEFLTPDNPKVFGTAQNPDTFFQNRIKSISSYNEVEKQFDKVFQQIEKVCGQKYSPYQIYGNKNAKNMIISMGSSCETIQEYIENNNIQDVCLCSVKLFRPFILNIPSSVNKICVLDRCKESCTTSPLALEVISRVQESERNVEVIKGVYGLGGKDFSPKDVNAVIENLLAKNSKDNFTIGIDDDQTFSSLPIKVVQENNDAYSIKIYGLGSDGSVSASKSTVKILGENYNKYIQGYFEYDSRKSGSMTISHIRISDKPIHSTYLVENSNLIMINNFSFVHRYNLLEGLKENGVVIFNSIFDSNEISKVLPKQYLQILKEKHAKVFVIDAQNIARECNLGAKINIIMMTALMKIANFIPPSKIKQEIKSQIQKTFARKGQDVIDKNINAMEKAFESINCVEIAIDQGQDSLKTCIMVGNFQKIFKNLLWTYMEIVFQFLNFHVMGAPQPTLPNSKSVALQKTCQIGLKKIVYNVVNVYLLVLTQHLGLY